MGSPKVLLPTLMTLTTYLFSSRMSSIFMMALTRSYITYIFRVLLKVYFQIMHSKQVRILAKEKMCYCFFPLQVEDLKRLVEFVKCSTADYYFKMTVDIIFESMIINAE
jgi:hypothetical protein